MNDVVDPMALGQLRHRARAWLSFPVYLASSAKSMWLGNFLYSIKLGAWEVWLYVWRCGLVMSFLWTRCCRFRTLPGEPPLPNSKKQDGMLPFFVFGLLVAVNVFLYSAPTNPQNHFRRLPDPPNADL